MHKEHFIKKIFFFELFALKRRFYIVSSEHSTTGCTVLRNVGLLCNAAPETFLCTLTMNYTMLTP